MSITTNQPLNRPQDCVMKQEKNFPSPCQKHKKPVGPHPCWSCQLAFKPEAFGNIVPWLALNRNGLSVLIHPETGHGLMDHSEYSIWLGKVEPLNLDIFKSNA